LSLERHIVGKKVLFEELRAYAVGIGRTIGIEAIDRARGG